MNGNDYITELNELKRKSSEKLVELAKVLEHLPSRAEQMRVLAEESGKESQKAYKLLRDLLELSRRINEIEESIETRLARLERAVLRLAEGDEE